VTRAFVGVDGGGTTVRAVLVDAEGRVLARAEAAGAVLREDAPGAAVEAVAGSVRRVLRAARVEVRPAALWAGLAGAGRERAREVAEHALSALGLADIVRVGTDAEAAFEAAFDGGPGMLLIAGTGSVGLGRAGDGRFVRVGGWGAALGDEGSAYWMVMQALGCAARADDGRAAPTKLAAAFMDRLRLGDLRELIPWVAGASKRDVAGLAPVVLDTAGAGDAVAASVVTDAVVALRSHVIALLERMELVDDPPQLALAGGLLVEGGPARPLLLELLRPLGLVYVDPPSDAAEAAARLAMRLQLPG
jgi:glucosamine kinase